MNKQPDRILNLDVDVFGFFDEVFLFGSSLLHNRFNDIDILLVYVAASPIQVNFEKENVKTALSDEFADCALHITTLSKSEMRQTRFLERVRHRRIKG